MKKRLCGYALLGVLATGLAGVASAAVSLDTLVATDGTITVGDKTFGNFSWNGPDLQVTGVGNGTVGNLYGLSFQGGLYQLGAGSVSYQLDYTVTAGPGYRIDDLYEQANYNAIGGSVNISEVVLTSPGGTQVGQAVVGTGYSPSTVANLSGAFKELWVQKSIVLTATGPGDFAVASIIDQRFSQTVPEPATCVAGLGGLLLAAAVTSRRKARRA